MGMKKLTLSEIALSCGGKYVGSDDMATAAVTSVVRDSRQVKEGSLFLCIKGAAADGHDYAASAYENGAVCCLAQRPLDTDKPYILVDSVLDSVRYIAKYYRSKLDIPFVGIVGSVGKTTAKEMTAAVLSRKYSVLKTPENLNNELGVPLTVLSIGTEHTAAVIEMGISDFGEMSRLAEIVRPDICVITTIGYCHLENLGDLNGVMRAKGEVFDYMSDDSLAVMNGDDDILRAYDTKMKKVTYGLKPDNDFVGSNIKNLGFDGVSCDISSDRGTFPALIHAFGSHVVSAALAAAAVGTALGMENGDIALGIGDYATVGGRASVINTGCLTVIDDCYNANPNSVKAALTSLSVIGGRRIAVLGDMLELGSSSSQLHYDVGKFASDIGVDLLIACGDQGKFIYDGFISGASEGYARYFEKKEDFLSLIDELISAGDTVLVKASHGMHFEEIVDRLKKLDIR